MAVRRVVPRLGALAFMLILVAVALNPGGSGQGLVPQDDAGSGMDAPDEPVALVWVQPGPSYQGNTTGLTGDPADFYAFSGVSGRFFRMAAIGGNCNTWRLHDAAGARVDAECRSPPSSGSAEIWFQAALNQTDTYYVGLAASPALVPVHYRFSFTLAATAQAPPEGALAPGTLDAYGVDACPEADPGEADRTHGAGDAAVPSLVWAALKTGFRAVVAWESPAPAMASLRVLRDDGSIAVVENPVPRTGHVFVLDGLPEGKLLCFQATHTNGLQATTSAWHALRLANAMNAYDAEEDVYTMSLLVLANEHAVGQAHIAAAAIEYEDRLRDATEGHVRSGAIIIVHQDLEKHNSGLITCGLFPLPFLPTCRTLVDVVYSFDNLPHAAGATFRDGIQTRTQAIYMNNVHTGFLASPSTAALVLLHEMGHYAFGMMDLYGELGVGANCYDAVTRISVMGNNFNAREFDDNTTRCPNEASIAGYTPSWHLMRERFPAIPDRPGLPVAGPFGSGSAFHLHVFHAQPGAGPGAVPQDDAGSGGDAPAGPTAAVPVLPGEVYQGNVTGTLGDTEDWYAFAAPGDVEVRLRALGGNCITWRIVNETGGVVPFSCSSPLIPPDLVSFEAHLQEVGTYFIRYTGNPPVGPAHYRFAFAFDAAPPEPLP